MSALSLLVRTGELTGRRIPVSEALVIGRGRESAVCLPDAKMSRQHARVKPKRSKLHVADLGSNNGTFVNGKQVRRATLRVGDQLRLGRTDLEVVEGAVESPKRHDPVETNRVMTLADFAPAKVEAMPTIDFMAALGVDLGPSHRAHSDEIEVLRAGGRNFAVVYNVAKALEEVIEQPELLHTAASFIFKVTDAERCHIALLDAETGDVVPGLSRHRNPDIGTIPTQLSRAIIERVIAEKTALITTDAASDEHLDPSASVAQLGIRSVLCVPILHGADVTGVIELDRLNSVEAFRRQDFEVMTVLASLLGVRLANVRLFDEQKRTIQALRDAQQELVKKERMAVLGRLTSGLAHEIANLMMPFTICDVLAEERPDDEELIDLCGIMTEAQRRIVTLLDEVRVLSKGGRPELRAGEHDLRETVESVIRFSRYDGEVRKHQLVVEAEPMPRCRFEQGGVKQVLLNLIRNAAQALEAPDIITIRIGPEPTDSEMARIDVIDRGKGIPEDVLARIWEPFFSTKESQGTGLGLDISRQIVERHGGRIVCQSEVGQGTTMTVLLPLVLTGQTPLEMHT